MPREVAPSLNEKEFVLGALQENIRIDGRSFEEYRDLQVSFGDEYGVANVHLGKSKYVPNHLKGLVSQVMERESLHC